VQSSGFVRRKGVYEVVVAVDVLWWRTWIEKKATILYTPGAKEWSFASCMWLGDVSIVAYCFQRNQSFTVCL
jgi:hypothetical protein